MPIFALDPGWDITVPTSITLPQVNWSLNQQQTTLAFPQAVVISNNQSSSNGFTAQITSTELIHNVNPALFMGYVNLEIKTAKSTGPQDGVSVPIDNIYTYLTGSLATSNPITFLTADTRSRNAGSWSITPTLRLTIPAKQKAGTYNATLTLSLY